MTDSTVGEQGGDDDRSARPDEKPNSIEPAASSIPFWRINGNGDEVGDDVVFTWEGGREVEWYEDISPKAEGLSVMSSAPFSGMARWVDGDDVELTYSSSDFGIDGEDVLPGGVPITGSSNINDVDAWMGWPSRSCGWLTDCWSSPPVQTLLLRELGAAGASATGVIGGGLRYRRPEGRAAFSLSAHEGASMPATIVSLTRLNGFPKFYCIHCAGTIFDEGGPAEEFCKHVLVVADPYGDPELGPAAADGLADKLDEIDADIPEELARLFDEDTVVFELVEPGRGGGHDGSVLLVALAIDGFEDEEPAI